MGGTIRNVLTLVHTLRMPIGGRLGICQARLPTFSALLGSHEASPRRPRLRVYEPVIDDGDLAAGKLVVIRRRTNGLEELSVRRVLSAVDGEARLASHSHDPTYRETLAVPMEGNGDVEIMGIVVGKYAPL